MMKRARNLIVGFYFVGLAAPTQVLAQSAAAGQKLYSSHCSSCHGDKGQGDGPAGKALPIKPADHTDGKIMNSLSDKFLFDIISKGGTAVGKSAFMPSWGGVLKDDQVRDVVAYVRSIANPPYRDKAAAK